MSRLDEVTYSEWQHVIGTLTLCFPKKKKISNPSMVLHLLFQTSGDEKTMSSCLGNRFGASWWNKNVLTEVTVLTMAQHRHLLVLTE